MKNITTYIFALTLFLISPAFAETYEVQMLNKLEKDRNVFNPSIIYINSGDTVKVDLRQTRGTTLLLPKRVYLKV
jgi:plastocyanin